MIWIKEKDVHKIMFLQHVIAARGFEPSIFLKPPNILQEIFVSTVQTQKTICFYIVVLKYSMVFFSPSSSLTFGSQSSFSLASEMSGRRIFGSS